MKVAKKAIIFAVGFLVAHYSFLYVYDPDVLVEYACRLAQTTYKLACVEEKGLNCHERGNALYQGLKNL